MRNLLFILLSITVMLSAGCGKKSSPPSPVAADAPILKIAVFADGHITANGSPTTLDSLRESFKQLAAQKGAVWYYREDAAHEGPPISTQVIQAVVAARLPIRLSTRPDYSDAVGLDGHRIK